MNPPETPQSSYEFEIFADYYQIYLQDESAEGNLFTSWNKEAIDNLFAIAPGIIGIGTVRNSDVPLKVIITKSRPLHDNFVDWDHIIEVSMQIPSGKIIIASPSDYLPDAARILVEPGTYRARIYYGKLESISEDGLEGDDHYQVVLWPEAYKSPDILKQRRVP